MKKNYITMSSYREILQPLVNDGVIKDSRGFHHYVQKLIVEDLLNRMSESGTQINDLLLLEGIKQFVSFNNRNFDLEFKDSINKRISKLREKFNGKIKKEQNALFNSLNNW